MKFGWGIWVVVVHILVTTPHSIAHTLIDIPMSLWQNIFIGLVIVLGPIVAAVLLWRRKRVGFSVLAVSMAGSLLFGVFYHFIAAGPDNVASQHAHAWTSTFQITAVLLAIIELVGVGVGIAGLRTRS